MSKRSSRFSVVTYLQAVTGLVFIAAGVIIVLLVNHALRREALVDAELQARLVLDRNLAIHTYFSQDPKPPLLERIDLEQDKDYF